MAVASDSIVRNPTFVNAGAKGHHLLKHKCDTFYVVMNACDVIVYLPMS